ncbi:MAG: hypothetical protein FJY75_06120 [Candidatus Eisenbacteria bacterium]|uniref:DUF4402 domain-containing protein n=1 Tax=Eiseniibacteriota bacterium TaxID=2212470 RepID=A0A937XBI4_UNCEI|nr:hypothetical protein [Candidatus Eisenbacteria bacterium]
MKAVLVLTMLAAGLALAPGPAVADGSYCCSDDATVSLSIETYCDVHFLDGAAAFSIQVANGATEGEATQPFFAGANCCVWLDSELTPPIGAPGLWSCEIDGVPSGTHIQFGPGIYDGPAQATVRVGGLDPFQTPAGQYQGGVMTLTLQVDP